LAVLVDEGVVFAGEEEGEEGVMAMPRVLGAEGGVVVEEGGEGLSGSRGRFVLGRGSFVGGEGTGVGDARVEVEGGLDGFSEGPGFEGLLALDAEFEGFCPAVGFDSVEPGDGGLELVLFDEGAGRDEPGVIDRFGGEDVFF
jgi:hypothetical protein